MAQSLNGWVAWEGSQESGLHQAECVLLLGRFHKKNVYWQGSKKDILGTFASCRLHPPSGRMCRMMLMNVKHNAPKRLAHR